MKKIYLFLLKYKYQSLIILIATIFFIHFQNNSIVINEIDYYNKNLPTSFEDFKILHISDLHNKEFDNKLIRHIEKINPNIIVITGDLIDSRNTNIEIAMNFIENLVKISDVYYVSGNHEIRSKEYDNLIKLLEKQNVIVLENKIDEIVINNEKINILGIMDFSFFNNEKDYQEQIKINEGFNLLLAHRPEFFDIYVDSKVDLVFSGHAHGGQIRLPFVGGLIAPGQGIFPKYTSGSHKRGGTTMIVSRGLGNSLFPIRVFNRPELIVVTLKQER